MPKYQINGKIVAADHAEFSTLLEQSHSSKTRPICMCLKQGIPMYITRIGDAYYVKRMPNTGDQHSSLCDSYQPPLELSGLGEVVGTAINENLDEGTTTIKLDFALNKSPGRLAPVPSGVETTSVKTDGNKLTIRAMLHYLYEQAGFNTWSPPMEGKRNWFIIRKYLLQSALDKTTKGANLSESLFIPEVFYLDKKAEIARRRNIAINDIAVPKKGIRKLMILIGEVKEIVPSRYGHKIQIKHLPDFPFMVNEDLHKKLTKKFQPELDLWDTLDKTHLLAIATFGINLGGTAAIEEIAIMNVNQNWIPFESIHEYELLEVLQEKERRFTKGLRYNMPKNKPIATAALSDTSDTATAIYIIPPGAEDDYIYEINVLASDSNLNSMVWDVCEQPLPDFSL
jgi:hypothetical protein